MSSSPFKRFHIIGRKKHGKTTLMTELIAYFTEQGLRVGSIKHTPHPHELDTPGKDSYRQRTAGSNPAAIVTPELIGLYLRHDERYQCYERLSPLFADCDLVLVEGHVETDAPKAEVWRIDRGTPPIAAGRDDILAVISDDPLPCAATAWPRHHLAHIAHQILQILGLMDASSKVSQES